MKLLYAPWRNDYVIANTSTAQDKKSCIFCEQLATNQDDTYFIIKRFSHCAVMLNLYPYNAGHLLLLPYEHKATLNQLTSSIRAELMEVINVSMSVLDKELECDGLNMGLNSGGASGGSIPDHVHIHVVPRWVGDTNFLEAIADTKPISINMHYIYKKLKEAFNK